MFFFQIHAKDKKENKAIKPTIAPRDFVRNKVYNKSKNRKIANILVLKLLRYNKINGTGMTNKSQEPKKLD